MTDKTIVIFIIMHIGTKNVVYYLNIYLMEYMLSQKAGIHPLSSL